MALLLVAFDEHGELRFTLLPLPSPLVPKSSDSPGWMSFVMILRHRRPQGAPSRFRSAQIARRHLSHKTSGNNPARRGLAHLIDDVEKVSFALVISPLSRCRLTRQGQMLRGRSAVPVEKQGASTGHPSPPFSRRRPCRNGNTQEVLRARLREDGMEFRIPDVDHARNYRDNVAAGCFAMAGTSLNDDKQATRQSYVCHAETWCGSPLDTPGFCGGLETS